MKNRIILIDDEESMRLSVSQFLSLADLEVKSFSDGVTGLKGIDKTFDGVVVTDIRMPTMDGMQLLQKITEMDPEIPVVLITAHGDIQLAVKAIREGAYDFLEKPFDPEILLKTVRRALEKRHLILENRHLKAELEKLPPNTTNLLGSSAVIQDLHREINELGPTDASVILTGETGSGKEVVARCLHEASERRNGPFVAINCGAIPETLFESELFGHEQGSFTGASSKHVGKFERAHEGTLFLDEITSMPLNLQVKVLRVLQDKEIERLGGSGPIPVDIRLISATNSNPRTECREGRFREDLFYRLNLAEVHIPPLRERGGDILLLFEFFTSQAAKRYSRELEPLSPTSTSILLSYPWPGNVRELKNCAERYVLSTKSPGERLSIILQHSQEELGAQRNSSLVAQAQHFEKCILEQSLRKNQGNIQAVMEELDLPRRTLNQKMQNHGLLRKDYIQQG